MKVSGHQKKLKFNFLTLYNLHATKLCLKSEITAPKELSLKEIKKASLISD